MRNGESSFLPRGSAQRLIVALACVALALGYAIRSEAPRGRVQGIVRIAASSATLEGAEVVLEPVSRGPEYRRRYAVTDKEGKFSLSRVTAGDYEISASSRAHRAEYQKITIIEGRAADANLSMARSQEDFALRQNQKVYGTEEEARLAVSGYVDGSKPPGADSMQVRIYRTRLSSVLQNQDTAEALEKVGRSWDAVKKLPTELLQPASMARPQRIVNEEEKISEGDREGFFYKRLNFGKLQNGLYLIDLLHGKDTLAAWLLVTNTAIVTKKANQQLVAYVVDMRSGKPLANSEVRTYRRGRVVARGRTDARGLTEMSVPKTAPGQSNDRLTTVALRGQDESVVKLDEYQREDGGDFVVHAYTDRPIYRPGQKIYFKGIARRKIASTPEPVTRQSDVPPSPSGRGAGDEVNRYSVPSGQPIDIEIRDPSGERILKERTVSNPFGSFAGSVELNPEAPTGYYTMLMRIGGEEHTHSILISSYRKPEFEVTVTPEKKRYARGEEVKVTVSGQYYFGSPVAGAEVTYYVYRSPDWSAEYPDDYGYEEDGGESIPDYYHGDRYYGEVVAEGKTTLDEDGKSVLTFPAKTNPDADGPQQEKYAVSVTVKDMADREAYEDIEVSIVPGDFRVTVSPVGYVAAPNQPTDITIQTIDHDRKPVPNVSVELETGFEVWNRQDGEYGYKSVTRQTVTTDANGRVVVPVTPPQSGSLILKARAKDSKGREILGRAYLWVVSDQGEELQTEYADLSVLTDKRRYEPGDTARVLINAANAGQTVLLTVEGERVYRALLVPMTKRSSVVRIPIRAEYGPNVFLAACYVRDKKFSQSEVPLRVALPRQNINVAIHADRDRGIGSSVSGIGTTNGSPTPNTQHPTPNTQLARYEPRDKITYRIETTDAKGRGVPAELSFGVVDEAIYALMEDDPTALRNAFYPRRYNQVTTRYSFAVEYLGDADKSEPKIEARKKFRDTAYWNPALRTDTNGVATVSFELPDNLTTWRATATAHTMDTRLGRAIQKVMVSKDFFVRVEIPRFLTQKDQSQVLVVVHNESGAPQSANVRFTAENLTINGDETKTISVEPGKTAEIRWPVTADGFGEAKLRVTAWTTSGGKQLTDGVELPLPIRPHGREVVSAFAGDLTADKPVTEVARFDPAAIPEASRLTIRITPSILSSLSGALDYLVDYPYGCTEQTMSRFLPTLLVQRALGQNAVASIRNQAEIPKMARAGLLRLYKLQHASSGGWGWWENDPDDPWMTAYVLYGFSVAQSQGYSVSGPVLQRGREAAVKLLNDLAEEAQKATVGQLPNVKQEDVKGEWKGVERAFLTYALSLAGGKAEAQAARKTLNTSKLSSEGLAYLILMDRRNGATSQATLAELNRRAVSDSGMLHWNANAGYHRENSNDVTTTAAALRALLAANPESVPVQSILRWLMFQRTGTYWSSTRDTSWTLAAFCDYLEAQKEYSMGGQVVVKLNGQEFQTLTLSSDVLREKEIALRVPTERLQRDRNELTFERMGGTSPVYYSVEMRQTIGMEDIPELTNAQLGIKREYLRVKPKQVGSSGWSVQTEPTNNSLNVGDRVRVRLTLTVPEDMTHVIIEDPFPSGCEVTERGTADEVVEWSYWWSSIDVRDDRVAFFARDLRKGKHVIEYNLRAQTPGTFHTLPTLLQAMYAPQSRAESSEAKVEVK